MKFAEVLLQNSDAFAENKSDLGSCSVVSHKINTAGAKPIRQPLRRTPLGFEGEEEKYLKDQIDNGVVKPSKSSWASPVCLVRKKDGSVRWCIDFRRLNNCTIKDAYPLPKISMYLDCLAEASIFSVMDLQASYWQLEVASEDRHLTAFIFSSIPRCLSVCVMLPLHFKGAWSSLFVVCNGKLCSSILMILSFTVLILKAILIN